MEKRWTVKRDCRGMTTNEIINAILEDRDVENIKELLSPTEDNMIPFEKMKNIDRAAKAVLENIENDGSFYVHFDVDVDGCSAGAIAVRWLKQRTDKVYYGVNQGKEHGIANFDLSKLNDIDVLIIVDSIESRMFPYEKVLNTNVHTIIVLDHHLVSKMMQKQMDRTGQIILVSSAVDYPNPYLSGSGVVWKFFSYIDWIELDDYSDNLVDLAACGIIADMVNIGFDSMENRYICHKGFNNQVNTALKKINGSYEYNAQAVSFGIAPLINASNRMNENEKAVELFLSDNSKEISSLINDLKYCKEAQNFQIDDIMPDLYEQAASQLDKKVMFFFTDEADSVKGLIANRLLSEYSRPIIVLGNRIRIDEETGEVINHEYFGSFRAVGVENFKEYVDNTGLVSSAGHENAAGIWFNSDVLDDFRNAIESALKDVEFVQETVVDIQITPEQITNDLIKKVKQLNKISGQGWPSISVMVSGINDYTVGAMSGGKHLKLIAADDDLLFIKWNYNGDWDIDGELTAIGGLDSGFFGRTYYRQLIMNDYKVVT